MTYLIGVFALFASAYQWLVTFSQIHKDSEHKGTSESHNDSKKNVTRTLQHSNMVVIIKIRHSTIETAMSS